VDGAFATLLREGCVLTCRDFLNGEVPALGLEHPARYLSSVIEGGWHEGGYVGRPSLREGEAPFQCVEAFGPGEGERALIVLGLNLSREGTGAALTFLRSSSSPHKALLYLFSFDGTLDEDGIAQAMLEPELLGMVRGTDIVVYLAMMDVRTGMSMLARIDGGERSIRYLAH
jgi:hypothetical protein